MRPSQWIWIFVIGLAAPVIGLAMLQAPSDFEHGVVKYASTEPADRVAHLQKRMDAGQVKLNYDERWGYLPAVLDALKIPRSSQGLVFSKTSLQLLLISPESPRALYFNDDVYIGAVQGGPIMEVAAVDPKLGPSFIRCRRTRTRNLVSNVSSSPACSATIRQQPRVSRDSRCFLFCRTMKALPSVRQGQWP